MMLVELLVDLNIDARSLAVGQRVELSNESARLLIRKGYAKEVKETQDVHFTINHGLHGGGGQLHDSGDAKKRAKGRGKH
jgi:hypothetical protein